MRIIRARSCLIGLVWALVMALQTAFAQTVVDGTRQSVRAVIEDQISAFQTGDNDRAYSHAAPSIQQYFPNVSQFIDMVRRSYQPVYRPRSLGFGKLRRKDGGLIQEVFVTGPGGRNWIAYYSLQQQSDGSWKITGVYLEPDRAAGA